LPAAFQSAERDSENVGRLLLRELVVPEEIEGLGLVFGERVHPVVELAPAEQCLRVGSDLRGRAVRASVFVLRRRVIGSQPARPAVVSSGIDQESPNRGRRQTQEISRRLDVEAVQHPVEADQRLLQDIVGFPPNDGRWEIATACAG